MTRLRVVATACPTEPIDVANVAVGVIADAMFNAAPNARPITGDQLHALEAAAPYARADARQLAAVVERRGRCVSTDPEAYFPVYVEDPARSERLDEERAEARRLCRGCPVIGQCLARDYAQAGTRVGGIWGVAAGLGARDRRALLPHWITLAQRLTAPPAAAATEPAVAS